MSLDPSRCLLLRTVSHALNSASAVYDLLNFVDTSKICNGNPEKKLLDQWQQRSLTLHGSYGKLHTICYVCVNTTIHNIGSKRGFLDDLSLPTGATVRHEHCQLLLSSGSSAVCCLACSLCYTYRPGYSYARYWS